MSRIDADFEKPPTNSGVAHLANVGCFVSSLLSVDVHVQAWPIAFLMNRDPSACEVPVVNQENDAPMSPIRVYQQLSFPRNAIPAPVGVLAKFSIYLPDRPGSLAGFASTIAHAGGNISFFHYDRSIDSSRVAAEAHFRDKGGPDTLLSSLKENTISLPKRRTRGMRSLLPRSRA